MSFYETLQSETQREADELFRVPFVAAAVTGEIDLDAYLAFLEQAYHHVKQTVPLLRAARDALGDDKPWLREALERYVADELGHDEWILADIAASGGDAEAVRRGRPDLPCELMVSYAHDVIHGQSPLGLFGMVHVLEGTSERPCRA